MIHTDALLRKHRLLLKIEDNGRCTLIDWQTMKPASKKREAAFDADFARREARIAATGVERGTR